MKKLGLLAIGFVVFATTSAQAGIFRPRPIIVNPYPPVVVYPPYRPPVVVPVYPVYPVYPVPVYPVYPTPVYPVWPR